MGVLLQIPSLRSLVKRKPRKTSAMSPRTCSNTGVAAITTSGLWKGREGLLCKVYAEEETGENGKKNILCGGAR